MAKMNVWKRMFPVRTHEGAVAQKVDAKSALRRTVLTCLLWEDTFYEKGNDIATRIAALAAENKPEVVAALAREARGEMQLRHAPLFLTRELARRKGAGPLVAETLEDVIQRADELGEFVSLYWKEKKQPLAAGVKRGLARAFTKFDAYQLAKYDRESAVKLRDVLFLCHAKPKDEAQAVLWKKLVENTLESPDAWEVALSAGKDKRENFERLRREGQLGGLAVLRNLCLMLASGVDPKLIRERLDTGVALRDAIVGSQAHPGTYLKRALTQLHQKREWRELDGLIVITDEQSHEGILAAWTPRAYVVNVAPYKHGVSYGNGWTHIDGWSERIVDYITAVEAEPAG